jgi:hypothetical protein
MKLNLGCGKRRKEGYVNIDMVELDAVDVIDDLKTLESIEDNSISEIVCECVLEHITNNLGEFIGIFQTFHRVLCDNGIVRIHVPHFTSRSSCYLDHKVMIHYDTLDVVVNPGKYSSTIIEDATFRYLSRRLCFTRKFIWNVVVSRIANRFPMFYEETFIRNIFPANSIEIVLEKVN